MKKNQPQINSDDELLWAELTKQITKTEQPQQIEKPEVELPPIRNSIDNTQVYSGCKLNELVIGKTADIDRNTAQKFRRGEFKIERRIDLHGYTEDAAWDAVDNFIKNAYIDGLRCVLIVTGKGLPRPENDIYTKHGIIRERVPQWLNSPQLRPLILSIAQAQIKDGGEGAVYVLLRRKR